MYLQYDDKNLAKFLADKLSDPNTPKNYTVEDFFKDAGVEECHRSDFSFMCIYQQALKILEARYDNFK